jgi:hypothetical protein
MTIQSIAPPPEAGRLPLPHLSPDGFDASTPGQEELGNGAIAERASTVHRPRHKLVTADLLTAVVLLAVAAYRAAAIGTHGEPSGLDFGNWLMFGHQALGHPLARAAHTTYPPVVPVLAVAITQVLGVVWGTAVLAGVASTAPALGTYIACRLGGARWSAVVAAVLLAATSSSGEAAAWGGVPQLLGLGLTAALLGVAQRALVRRRWQTGAAFGLLLLALAATSHLILAQAGAALVVLVLIGAILQPRSFGRGTWLGKQGWTTMLFLALVPSAVLVPLYLKLLPTVGGTFVSQGSGSSSAPMVVFLQSMFFIYRDGPWFWKPALIITAFTPVLLGSRKYRHRPDWAIVTALDLSLTVEAVLSGQERLIYVAPIAVALAAAMWLSVLPELNWRERSPRTAPRSTRLRVPGTISLLTTLAVAYVSAKGLAFFPTQRAFYDTFVPPGTVAGLNWIRSNTPADALIAVAPINGAPYGWWVQGYGRRAALVGSEDQWLNFPEERARANEVDALLSEQDPLSAAVLERAAQLRIQYLLLPWAWGGLALPDLAAYKRAYPRSVVFDNQAMVVVRVTPQLHLSGLLTNSAHASYEDRARASVPKVESLR